jgi:hypothetical protein
MGITNIFGGHCDKCKCKEEVEKLLEIVRVQALIIHDLTKPKPNPVKFLLINTKTNLPIMALEIAANQFSVGALSLVDTTTNAQVTGVFSAVTAVSDNTAVANATVNADGTVTVTGVSAGTANVTVSATAAFTNSLGVATSSPVSLVIGVTIDAVAVADSVALVVTFGAPQAQ